MRTYRRVREVSNVRLDGGGRLGFVLEAFVCYVSGGVYRVVGVASDFRFGISELGGLAACDSTSWILTLYCQRM